MKNIRMKFDFLFVPVLNAMNVTSNAIKEMCTDLVKDLDARNRIAATLSRSEEHTKAWEYLKTSEWTSGQLAIWVELTGKLPPDDMKEYPREALQTLDIAVHFSPEHIETMKQRVMEVLGDNNMVDCE